MHATVIFLWPVPTNATDILAANLIIMSTTGDRLKSSGVAFAGEVATNLIENVLSYRNTSM